MNKNAISWALAGGKYQAIKLVTTAIELNAPPAFISPAPDLPHNDRIALTMVARDHNIPIVAFSDLNSIRLKNLDFLLTCRYPILSKELFSAPRFGSFNFHNSLLPQYRGTHPVSWVLINDEKETGVTLHFIDEKIDNGPILFQQPVSISDNMNLWHLTEQLETTTCQIFKKLINHLNQYGDLPPMETQQGTKSTAPRRYPDEGRIDFSMSARQIVKLVKALPAPLPNAFCFLNSTPITFTDAELADDFYSEQCQEGTVQAKILPNIYIIKAKNAFIKMYSDFNIPIGAVLE
jgi:methionyl-tRNA formyltransferase